MAAASDAAGAAAGAIVGVAIGTQYYPGVGSATCAAIGAAIAGVVSSAEGWDECALCIIVPYSKIYKKVEAEN